jgi:hypothetical protein
MPEGRTAGFTTEPNQTVAGYLTARLEAQNLVPEPTSRVRYRTAARTAPRQSRKAAARRDRS